MKPVITPDESARLDAAATDPVEVLMERAGLGVALAAARMGAGYGTRVLALAGPGNNGGDVYVAVRYLKRRGVAVEVRALGYPKGEDSPARQAAVAAVAAGVPVRPLGDPEPCDLLIDGLFGAGFHGALSDPAAAWTAHPFPVLAIDLPSGLSGADGSVAGAAFTARRTVTFHALKVGHLFGEGPDRCGEVEVVDIGLQGGEPELRLCEEADAPVPSRPRTAHKWSAGTVLVVGGSPGISGAVALAGRAALHFGAGYVRLACPGALQSSLASADPSLTTAGIGTGQRFTAASAAAVLAAGERFAVMALGPGLGPGREGFVRALLEAWDRPLVLDADAIAAAGVEALAARGHATVITPHAGEFRRLTGEDAGYRQASHLAGRTGAVVLLKGNPTVIAGRQRWVVNAGGPELATLGSGDVLTGMIAALIARGLDPEAAARSAAFRHGRAAADLAAAATVTASGLAAHVGRFAR
ncbi:MAG: NAD(P)H-hydrate dehydratase [Actinomycetota bacterium]